jgi:hypothetical protein
MNAWYTPDRHRCSWAVVMFVTSLTIARDRSLAITPEYNSSNHWALSSEISKMEGFVRKVRSTVWEWPSSSNTSLLNQYLSLLSQAYDPLVLFCWSKSSSSVFEAPKNLLRPWFRKLRPCNRDPRCLGKRDALSPVCFPCRKFCAPSSGHRYGVCISWIRNRRYAWYWGRGLQQSRIASVSGMYAKLVTVRNRVVGE